MKRSVIATAVLLAFSVPVWAGDNPIGILIEGNDKSEISAFENLNVGTAVHGLNFLT